MQKLSKKKFLEFGEYTQPFLNLKNLKIKIERDYNIKHQQNEDYTILNSLMNYLKKYVESTKDEEYKQLNKFKRTAKKIWDSKKSTGCTDFAYLFATCARQLGIPTTILHTARQDYVEKVKSHSVNTHSGHAFCECFYEGKWILVDPTYKIIFKKYEIKNIVVDYMKTPCVYVAYERNLDLGDLNFDNINQRIYTNHMDEMCKQL